MQFPAFFLAVALFLSVTSTALNIIATNDDGFASANIREFYRLLKAPGHNAYLSSISQAEEIIPKGVPSFGTDLNDSHIWYYNGTPAATTFFALDYVVPRYWNGTKVDLLVSGPNSGDNLGSFLYTLSGTIGATYSAVERSIPAIAFSAGNNVQRGYKEIHATTESGYPDPATIDAQLSVDLVTQLVKNGNATQLLPFGYGINVNYPEITSLTDSTCVDPPFIQTRMTGGGEVDTAVFNESTGLFRYGTVVSAGLNTCINGDCSLPGKTVVVDGGCFSSVTVFTVDHDAPTCDGSANVRPLFQPLVQYQNSTSNAMSTKRGLRSRIARARLVGA